MANLLSQNIGTNYKSILNLDATTINTPLDTTLRAVTDGMGTSSPLQLSTDQVGLIRTVALSAGATNPRLFNEVYTINNSGAQTGTLTGIFLNAIETNLNGMTHNLMDLQRNSSSVFKIQNNGFVVSQSGAQFGSDVLAGAGSKIGWASRGFLATSVDGNIALYNSGATTFGLLQLGGITSSFPSIKRNGAAIDFRLADDSGFCAVNSGVLSVQNTVSAAVGVASTHKVTIVIAGVTYFLLASNV
jgi:hypothetical protein